MDIKNKNFWLMQGDCLERMKEIKDNSVDLILTDPPYGTTACKWDSVIHLDLMWLELKRIIKTNGAIVMTASQPFTTKLISSNYEMFKYEWIWEKSKATGFFDVQYRPMKQHENVLVFGLGGVSNCSNPRMNYYPQGTSLLTKPKKRTGKNVDATTRSSVIAKGEQTVTNFPLSIIGVDSASKTVHPTQKPVELMEYLIKTYTNESDVVLDFTMGSGTTGVACVNQNRKFIGIEMDEGYFKIAKDRIEGSVKNE